MEFKNVYLGIPRDETIRTTFFASKRDIALLRSFDPKEGVFQTTLSILLTKLCNELRLQQRIEQGDYSGFHRAVCDAVIHLGGSPLIGTSTGTLNPGSGQTTVPNVRRRAKRVAREAKGPSESNDVQGASQGGGGDNVAA
ncbi:MAG: hypothetical protein KGL39_08505 [Patescibacteria group bacterium]|nr:hypothetical protein [Patescibacteria group bacterium]